MYGLGFVEFGGLELKDFHGLGFAVLVGFIGYSDIGFEAYRAWGLGFWVWGLSLGFRVSGPGFPLGNQTRASPGQAAMFLQRSSGSSWPRDNCHGEWWLSMLKQPSSTPLSVQRRLY